MSFQYLKAFFLKEEESKKIEKSYREGKILSGEMKKIFQDKLTEFIKDFQAKEKKISEKDVSKCILTNEDKKFR